MTALPALILLSLTVSLGLYLGQAFLRRQPRRPMLIGLHLLFGIGSLEGLVIALHADTLTAPGAGGPGAPGTDRLAVLVLALVALALFSGLMRAVLGRVGRSTATATLALHAGLAGSGFAAALLWISRHFPAA